VPQFAVITRSFRVLTPAEAMPASAPIRLNFGRHDTRRCVFDEPKAYLVAAADAVAAVNLVKSFAASENIPIMVHRAIEVWGTLPELGEIEVEEKPAAKQRAAGRK
jgi:hypothetical protein